MRNYPVASTSEKINFLIINFPNLCYLKTFRIIFITQGKNFVHKTFIFIVFWKCYKTAIKCAHLWNCLLNFDQHSFWGFSLKQKKKNPKKKDKDFLLVMDALNGEFCGFVGRIRLRFFLDSLGIWLLIVLSYFWFKIVYSFPFS